MGREVPEPTTGPEIFLAAIHDRLGEILARLPASQPVEAPPGKVELREPAQPTTPTPRKRAAKPPQKTADRRDV